MPPLGSHSESHSPRNDFSMQEQQPLADANENSADPNGASDPPNEQGHRPPVHSRLWCMKSVSITIWQLLLIGACMALLVIGMVSAWLVPKPFYKPDNVTQNRPLDNWVIYNGTAYYYSEDRRNWTASKDFCKEHGATLVDLQDDRNKECVTRFAKHRDEHWCGNYREDGEWKWLNETSAGDERLNNISGENCKTWAPDGFISRDCSTVKYFICIRSLQLQITGP